MLATSDQLHPRGLVVDLFAGGGGASLGIALAIGRPVDVAINHDATAIAVHEANHPETAHLVSSVWDVDPLAATAGAPVDILWASPDCTHFSAAKGDVPRSQGIRSLAWVVVCWAKAVRPRVILLENVREFTTWGPLGQDRRPCKRRAGVTFRRWVEALERRGYVVDFRVLDSADYGAPTRRRRLFVVARCDGEAIAWPEPTHGPGREPWRTASECIDWSLPVPSIFGRKKPLAEKTLRRIAEGVRRYVFESAEPFLVHVNHGRDGWRGQALTDPLTTVTASRRGHALVAAWLVKHYGGVVGHELERPVGTITARDHHSLGRVALRPTGMPPGVSDHIDDVRSFLRAHCSGMAAEPSLFGAGDCASARRCLGLVEVAGVEHRIVDIGLRMLEPHELLRAQFGEHAKGYDLSLARTKAAKVRLVGNSVVPHVAAALVRANHHAAQGASWVA